MGALSGALVGASVGSGAGITKLAVKGVAKASSKITTKIFTKKFSKRTGKELIDDFTKNPNKWRLKKTIVEKATKRKWRGGTSVENIYKRKWTRERLELHRVYNKYGKLVHKHFRTK